MRTGHVRAGDRAQAGPIARTPKFTNRTDKCFISFRLNSQKCYNKSAVRWVVTGRFLPR